MSTEKIHVKLMSEEAEYVSVSHVVKKDYTLAELVEVMLQDKVELLPQIKEATVRGAEEMEVEIAVDIYKMSASKVSFDNIINAIRSENTTISGGNVLTNGLRKNIRVLGEIDDPQELQNVVVKRDGGNIFLRDIAEIKFREKDRTTFAREYGKPVVMLDVKKRAGKNMIEAVESIKQIVQEEEANYYPESLHISLTNDQSIKTENQVKIVLSRAHADFIRRLFEVEVPEVSERIIEIKAMAREAGHRTKVAVSSIDSKVDAVGACVGVRGSRIKNIVDELGGEKIDIVRWSEDAYSSATQRGALAFFGDKYGEKVRLIEIANGSTFSFEVCGGTHVERTGELGAVYILGESSVGAGMRRIEAISGRAAEREVRTRFNMTATLAATLQTAVPDIVGKVHGLLDDLDGLRHKNEALERRLSLTAAEGLLELKQEIDGVSVLAANVMASSADTLREMGDWLRHKLGSGVVVLGSVVDNRPMMVAMVTADLVEGGLDASRIVKGAAKAIQGGGGGRRDVAQAGGRRADKLDEALSLVPGLVREKDAGS